MALKTTYNMIADGGSGTKPTPQPTANTYVTSTNRNPVVNTIQAQPATSTYTTSTNRNPVVNTVQTKTVESEPLAAQYAKQMEAERSKNGNYVDTGNYSDALKQAIADTAARNNGTGGTGGTAKSASAPTETYGGGYYETAPVETPDYKGALTEIYQNLFNDIDKAGAQQQQGVRDSYDNMVAQLKGVVDYDAIERAIRNANAEQQGAISANYADLLNQLQNAVNYDATQKYYEDSSKAQQEALDANYNLLLNQLNSTYANSQQNLQNQADKSMQEAYVNYMMNMKDLPSQLARMGMTGGASETTLARLMNQYGNNRNQIASQLADNLRALETERGNSGASLATNYNTNYANALSQLYSQLADLESQKNSNNLSIASTVGTNRANQLNSASADLASQLSDLARQRGMSEQEILASLAPSYLNAINNAQSNYYGQQADARNEYINLLAQLALGGIV